MKNLITITSLVAAAAMTSTAFAETVITENTTISGDFTESEAYKIKSNAVVTQTAGTVNLGRLLIHTDNNNNSESYILNGGVLNVTGGDKKTATQLDESSGAIIVGHWGNNGGKSTLTVANGTTLNATNGWTFLSWDTSSEFNVSGEANLYGITFSKGVNYKPTATLNLNAGGRLNLGAGGFANEDVTKGAVNINMKGGTLGALEDWSSSAAMTFFADTVTTIDTTKRVTSTTGSSTAVNGDSSGATITLSGTLSGLTGTNLVLSGNGTVDLTNAIFALTGDGSIDGKTISLFAVSEGTTVTDSYSRDNFTWNGKVLSERTEVSYGNGSVTFTGEAFELYWKGGSAGTWDTTTATTWGKDSVTGADSAFVAGDNVFFNTAGDVAVTLSEGLSAETITISDGNVTFSNGYVSTVSGTTVSGSGVLNLGKKGDGSASFLRGKLTIENGGKVNLTGGDATGYGENCISDIVINENGELNIAKSFASGDTAGNNQTINGGITLQGGKITGVDPATNSGAYSKFDLYNSSKGITTLASGMTAEISASIGLRNNGTFNVAAGTTSSGIDLQISGSLLSRSSAVESPSETFSTTLNKTGAGTMKLTGDNTYWTTGGTISAGKLIAASTTALGTGAITVMPNATLEIDIGAGQTMTQASGAKILSDVNVNAKLVLTSGTLVLTNAENNFRGTVDIKDGAILQVGEGAKLLKEYSNQSKIWIRAGGELRMNDFSYGQLGGSPDYAVHRQLDGGKISITGAEHESGLGFTVTSNGGTFEMTTSGQTLTLKGNGNSETIALNGVLKLGGAGDIVINKNNAKVAITGAGSLEKIGSGTLTINAAGNTYSGGTTVSAGTLVAGNASALGSGAVKIDGGQLSVASGVTLNNSVIEIVLSDKYRSDGDVAAITGEGSITFNGNKITLSRAEESALTLAAETSLSFSVISDGTFADSLTEDSFTLAGWDGWTITSYVDGVITLNNAVPEPSMFGLLAGLGALALVGARRRRKTK